MAERDKFEGYWDTLDYWLRAPDGQEQMERDIARALGVLAVLGAIAAWLGFRRR